MIPLALAAITGGAATVALLWTFGSLVALAAAPFGGSLAAVGAAILLAHRRSAPADVVLNQGLADA